jgi:hypothetical protein
MPVPLPQLPPKTLVIEEHEDLNSTLEKVRALGGIGDWGLDKARDLFSDVCAACEGTGKSSRGNECVPCGGTGARKE